MEQRSQELLPGPIGTNKEHLTPTQQTWLQVATDYEHSQSDFKTRHFVGDAQITPYQKFKQFLLELRSREELIERHVTMDEEKTALIEYEEEKAAESESPAFKKVCKARVKDLDRERLIIRRRLSQTLYERDQYLRMLQEMYDSGEAYLEDGTDLLDAIRDPYLNAQLERDHWISRMSLQAAMDLMTYGHIGTGNLEAITQMDNAAAMEAVQTALVFANKLNKEIAQKEAQILPELDNLDLSSLRIHQLRKEAKTAIESSLKKEIE